MPATEAKPGSLTSGMASFLIPGGPGRKEAVTEEEARRRRSSAALPLTARARTDQRHRFLLIHQSERLVSAAHVGGEEQQVIA